MFSNVGWGEILVLLIVGLVLIGPERLPGLIKEVRAVLLAVRNAVLEAREQLDGELGEDFRELSKPLKELNSVRQMGARGFITKTLLDGDDSFLTSFDETKKDLQDTANSLRSGGRSGVAPTNSASTNSATTHNATDKQEGVEISQQAEFGESRLQDSLPVQQAGGETTQDLTKPKQQPGAWDDVI